jgi:MFS family permease
MHATTAPAAVVEARQSRLINRDFKFLWAGQAISNLGDIVFDTTVALWIFTRLAANEQWAPLAVSGVLVAAAIPDLLIGPFAGVLVDRANKRSLLIRMDAIRAALITLLALLTGTLSVSWLPVPPPAWQLGGLYAAVFLAGVCAQFFGPARMAMIGHVVPEARRAQAAGLSQTTSSIAIIVGPVVAVPIFFAVGAGAALLANAGSFCISMILIAATSPNAARAHEHEPGVSSFLTELGEGLRFFAGDRVLVTLLISVMLVMLGAGCINALDIFFLRQNLHASTQLFGLLNGVAGLGLLVGAVACSLFAARIGIARLFWIGLVSLGLLVLVYARLTSFAPAVAIIFLIGIPNAAVNVVIGPLLLRVTPQHLVGRVAAVINPAITFAALISTACAGLLVSTVLKGFHAVVLGMHWGPIDLVFSWTGIAVIAAGLVARANLRDLQGAGKPARQCNKGELDIN